MLPMPTRVIMAAASALTLAAAIAMFRFEIAPGPDISVFRYDRITGEIRHCLPARYPVMDCDISIK